MRLENFRVFLEVAKVGSMTAASETLYTTPQNVSKLVRELENQMGVKLFNRAKGNLTLSEAGKRAEDVIIGMMASYEGLLAEFAEKQENRQQSSLRILANYVAAECMVEIIDEMLFADLDTKVEMAEADLISILKKGMEKQIDADYVFLQVTTMELPKYITGLSGGYELYLLLEEKLRVYMNRQAVYAEKKCISSKQLAHLPLLGFVSDEEGAAGGTYDVISKNIGVRLQTVLLTSKIAAWKTYLKANKGYVLATPSLMKNLIKAMGPDLISRPLRESEYAVLIMGRKKREQPMDDALWPIINRVFKKTIRAL